MTATCAAQTPTEAVETRPGASDAPLRAVFALPGLHRVNRGAEVALESVADELGALRGVQVMVIGSGTARPDRRYRFRHAGCIARERFERWPRVPLLRGECVYEELSFVPGLLRAYRSREYDLTVTCGYPYTNWVLRAKRGRARRPAHVYVTQNGDWPARQSGHEYRLFGCDGLVCTNPEYFARHRDRWRSALIPNGVDPRVYAPAEVDREARGLPVSRPVALMVSALIESKRVLQGIRCAAAVDGLHLVIAGDGPLRRQVDALGQELMPGRFQRVRVAGADMPDVYRAADVFLHMSQGEPFGIVYLEALASGLPVVAHDRETTRWIVEEQAVLVNTSDETAVVEGLQRALDMRTDEYVTQRRQLVERRFTWRSIAQQYVDFFRQVLDGR